MPTNTTREFLAGVVEGFYGRPWSAVERVELFDWMAHWGLNTYLYAPKDDLKHRSLWREPYSADDLRTLQGLVQACSKRGIRFIYAVSPGLDIGYGMESDLEALRRRLAQMLDIGCADFALLFDDIPGGLKPAELERWGSLAAAQCHVANSIYCWVRDRADDRRFLFCPTPYCGRMAEHGLGGAGYLETIGRELEPGIDVLWTGPEIISREIALRHIQEVQTLLRRRPIIWDNLHASDYDGRRFYCGPYAGRAPELRGAAGGLLSNCSCEFPLNFVPLRTLVSFVKAERAWDARQAYLAAMREWWPRFETVHGSVDFDDLVLFGDCYYLPHEEGPEAEALFKAASQIVATSPAEWSASAAEFREKATRLRDFCGRLTELGDRALFHALSRRAWELRDELELLLGYMEWKSATGASRGPCPGNGPLSPTLSPSEGEREKSSGAGWQRYRSDFHLPGTYRGGLVARLQRLLVQHPDGSFTPTESAAALNTEPV